MIRLVSYISIGLLFMLAGCSEPPYFEEMKTLEESEWRANEPVAFTFEVSDTEQPYDLLLNLRHTEAYPFSNLYLFMTLKFPNGKESTDTLECRLADERGMWLGRTPGDLVDHRILLNNRAIFPLEGEYEVAITQAMRVDPLPEVLDVGFALEKWVPEN